MKSIGVVQQLESALIGNIMELMMSEYKEIFDAVFIIVVVVAIAAISNN